MFGMPDRRGRQNREAPCQPGRQLQWPSSSEAPQRLHPVGISMLPGEIDQLQSLPALAPWGPIYMQTQAGEQWRVHCIERRMTFDPSNI